MSMSGKLIRRSPAVAGVGPARRGHSDHVKRTFRQQAIIDKLARVPVNGWPGAVVMAYVCPPGYAISIGRHGEPAVVDNGKIDRIAEELLRGPHQPKR